MQARHPLSDATARTQERIPFDIDSSDASLCRGGYMKNQQQGTLHEDPQGYAASSFWSLPLPTCIDEVDLPLPTCIDEVDENAAEELRPRLIAAKRTKERKVSGRASWPSSIMQPLPASSEKAPLCPSDTSNSCDREIAETAGKHRFQEEAQDSTSPSEVVSQSCERESSCSSFVAFAMGCLSSKTREKAGHKLGVMGGVTAADMPDILVNLECHAARSISRAQDGGLSLEGQPVLEGLSTVCSFTYESGNFQNGSSQEFTNFMLDFCRVKSLPELYSCFPCDGAGNLDLLSIFGLEAIGAARHFAVTASRALTASSSGSATDDANCDQQRLNYKTDYAENNSDLPPVEEGLRLRADALLLKGGIADSDWDQAAAAVNVLRATMRSECPDVALLKAVAQHCGSRRPALSKASCRALAEFAGEHPSAAMWLEAHVMEDLLGAIKSSKLAIKVAETALDAIVDLMVADGHAEAAALELCEVIAAAISPKLQAQMVCAGLKALERVARSLSVESEVQSSAQGSATEVCSRVLANRGLGVAFAPARAVLRTLDSGTKAKS